MNRTFLRWCLPGLVSLSLCAPVLAVYAASIETGFSPEGTGLQLVLKTIMTAQLDIRLMGYSFTSPEVVRALVQAHRRGVDVKVVLDDKGNRNRSGQAAMNTLVNAGIPVRTNSRYAILHDKVLIVDGRTVETGSMNFTRSGATRNSENVLVIRDMPALAQQYLAHWQSRWDSGTAWTSAY
ncbi:phospholipase D family protein (plasmid) [Klebsiella sp. WOUb02]|uniref:phospholipase D family nuclease n=1 Tax=Klebsiella sp. WOUb02 TaxID=3161071 RepID=UPI003CEBB30B